ncbi:hypothetical protein [Nostoc sp. PA-18-2419]|nr:hypothetical protein [Nostoc sp. PA-18-2419]
MGRAIVGVDGSKPSRESKAIVAVVSPGVDMYLLQNWGISDF